MLLRELFESTSSESATSTLKTVTGDFIRAISQMIATLKEKSDNPRIARMMVGKQKADWVNNNYLSSKQFGVTGLQPAASLLAKRAKDEKARFLFKRLANIRLSAMKESGRAQVFDQIGELLEQIAVYSKDKELSNLLKRVGSSLDNLAAAREALKTPKEDGQQKLIAPKSELPGQQNKQAEEMFQSIIQTLPNDVRKKVLKDTNRMDINAKMAYLRKMM